MTGCTILLQVTDDHKKECIRHLANNRKNH